MTVAALPEKKIAEALPREIRSRRTAEAADRLLPDVPENRRLLPVRPNPKTTDAVNKKQKGTEILSVPFLYAATKIKTGHETHTPSLVPVKGLEPLRSPT